MKIRTGFVSNSSSSSFCIYGYSLDGISSNEIYELEKKVKDERVGIHNGQYDSYIGAELLLIKDDETGKQFKDNIKKVISEVLGKDVECHIYEESWYNG